MGAYKIGGRHGAGFEFTKATQRKLYCSVLPHEDLLWKGDQDCMKREIGSQRLQRAGLTSKINSGEKTNEGSTGTDVVGSPTRAYHFIPSFLVINNFLRGNWKKQPESLG